MVLVLWLTLLVHPVLATPQVTAARLLDRHGWGTPVRDGALDAAAVDLARRLAGPVEGPTPHPEHVQLRAVMGSHGVSDAQVYPFTVRYRATEGLESRLPALLGRLERRLPPTHFGVGTYGIGNAVTTTLLLVHRGVDFEEPLPRTAEPGAVIPIRGALRRGYFKPRVLVAPPGGRPIRERPAWTADRAVELTLFFDAGPGVYGIEVVADSQYGPVVLDNHRIYVGVEPPPGPVVRLSPDASPTLAVQQAPDRLLGLINDYRAERGLGALRHDPVLAEVSLAHAKELARRRTLVHASPDTGTLTTRLRDRSVPFAQVAENLAEAADPRGALRAFLDSPGHTRNLLLPGLTHVGVGVSGRYYAVALVEAVPVVRVPVVEAPPEGKAPPEVQAPAPVDRAVDRAPPAVQPPAEGARPSE